MIITASETPNGILIFYLKVTLQNVVNTCIYLNI